ncbi:ornithine cyclodeaminase [soil metagenome]
MSSGVLPFLDSARLRELLPWPDSITAIETTLLSDTAAHTALPRTVVETDAGQLLLMPAAGRRHAGVKIATVAPGNPAAGLPRIQGVYVLFDADTLSPVALMDAAELTVRRTAAVSAVAVAHLAPAGATRLVVFGTGPQARGHLAAIAAIRHLERVTVIGRDPGRLSAFLRSVATEDFPIEPGTGSDLAAADIVVCATSSRRPLFDSTLLPDHATVVAIGSHEPTAREVDTALVARATVVVESRESALREAGDLLIPIAEGGLGSESIAGDLGQLVRGQVLVPTDRPRLFTSVGEAWEDLALAGAALDRST